MFGLLARALLMFVLLLGGAYAQTSAQPDIEAHAQSIVERADLVRFPREAFEVLVSVSSTTDGEDEKRQYRVLSKGAQNTIVMITEPASERGQVMLMKGRDLWVFLPSVSQPVRLSLAQRLTGQVANGDIAKANFSGDYDAKVLRNEKVDGENVYVLELTANDRSVAYHRVVYWVRQSNSWPLKAEFYSVSDRLLKTCLYQNYKTMQGRMRPTRLVLQDALRAGNESIMEYDNMRLRDMPDRMFSKDYLKRLD